MILIVGGGPAGSKAARLLSKDHDVSVIEEHGTSGRPVQCTGLISDEVIGLSGVKVDEWNSLYGAHVHFPNGNVVTARSKTRKAVLMDRGAMDERMAEAAQDAGVAFHYDTKYLGHSVSDGNVSTVTSTGTMASRMIIGADGYRSTVSGSIGNNNAREYVRGIQADIRKRYDDKEMMNLYIGSEYAPGFFAWVIPFEDSVRVGLCSSMNALPPVEYLKNIIRKEGLQDCKIFDKQSGMIPLGGKRTTFADNLLLIGDAAGQVKPISGGGLYPAFRASYALRDTVNEAFEKNDMTSGSLSIYEKRWKGMIGKELRNGYRMRRIYKRMSDRSLSDISDVLLRDDVSPILDDLEIDNPSTVAPKLMKNIHFLSGAIGSMFRTLLGI